MIKFSPQILGARVLIVDDTALKRALMSRHLTESGFEHVAEVEDGKQAIEYLENNKVDLILLDIMMPVMNGFQTLEQLKESGKLDDLAVVMVTAVDEIESVAQCIELGASDYMPKLFNPILLNVRIESNLERLFMHLQPVVQTP